MLIGPDQPDDSGGEDYATIFTNDGTGMMFVVASIYC